MLIKPTISQLAKIKVIGVGGAGSNAINTMITVSQIKGVDFVAINTDAQALLTCLSDIKIQIGENLTKGLGSGGVPEIGRQAAEESKEKLMEYLKDTDMVFITAGMGGGTGTGASSIIADIAKQQGILTLAVVTKPFLFEGSRRMQNAEEGIANLKDKVDTLIVIPNQKLLETVDKKMTLLEAFKIADNVLSQGVQGISDIITVPGLINVDFADVKSIMKDSGTALMGIGVASGEDRAVKAAEQAISSTLLEATVEGARGVLFNIAGGEELLMAEIDAAAKVITSGVDRNANIIFGTTIDKNLKDSIKVTVIATGFDESKQAIKNLSRQFADLKSQQPGTTPAPAQTTAITTTSSSQTAATDDQHAQKPAEEQKTEESVIGNPVNLEEENDPFDIPAFMRQNGDST